MNTLAVGGAIVALLVGLGSIGAVLVTLGRILQRLEDIGRIVSKIEDTWIVELRTRTSDVEGKVEVLSTTQVSHADQLAGVGKKIDETTGLAHELAKDLARATDRVGHHGEELGTLRTRVDLMHTQRYQPAVPKGRT